MSQPRLAVARDGAILRVDLDRPERRNALDTATLEQLTALFEGLKHDFETRVVVLGGRGPAFCAGADRVHPPGSERLGASSGASERERRSAAQLGQRACRAIEQAEVVSLARVHGYALGGGLALALACDFRIAARDAYLQLPEVDLGVPLTWGALPRLLHEVGGARARELVLLGERVEAPRAEAWGLLHRCVAPQELDAAVDAWARRLADKPEIAVHMTKTQLRAYAALTRFGDVTESDGDLLVGASRVGAGRRSFPGVRSRGPQGSG